MELTIQVICENLPGTTYQEANGDYSVAYEAIHLGIQRGNEVVEAVPANRKRVVFKPSFRVAPRADGKTNFLGPFVKGTLKERFFYLSSVVKDADGNLSMFRRAKIHLSHLTWSEVENAFHSRNPLSVTLSLTDKRGGPRCGSIRANEARWQT